MAHKVLNDGDRERESSAVSSLPQVQDHIHAGAVQVKKEGAPLVIRNLGSRDRVMHVTHFESPKYIFGKKGGTAMIRPLYP